MKLYAIVEIDDEDYEGDFEEWYITGDGLDIRYTDNGYRYYKAISGDMLKLKPLPQKDFIDEAEAFEIEEDFNGYVEGWNDCIDEILGGRK